MALEDMLSGILNDPESMGKILELAQSLGGSESAGEESKQSGQAEPPGSGLLQGLLGNGESGPDPEVMNMVMKLFSAWDGAAHSEEAQVLQALKTVSRPERQEKIDRALRAVRLARLAHSVLHRGEEER